MRSSRKAFAFASPTDLRSLVQSIDQALLVLDFEGRSVFINPKAENLFGLDMEDLIGEPPPFSLSEGDQSLQLGEDELEIRVRVEELVWEGNLATAYFIEKIDQSMAALEARLHQSQEEFAQASQELVELRAVKGELDKRLAELDHEFTLSQSEVAAAAEEVEGLKEEKSQVEEALAELEERLNSELEKTRMQSDEWDTRRATLESTAAELGRQLRTSEDRAAQLQTELELLEEQARKSDQRAAVAEGSLRSAEDKAHRYRTLFEELEASAQQTTSRLAVAEENLRAAETRAERYRRLAQGQEPGQLEKELEEAQTRVAELEGQVAELQTQLNAVPTGADQEAAAEPQVEELNARIENLQQELEEKSQRVARLEQDLERKTQDLATRDQELARADDELSKKDAELARKPAEPDELKAEIAKLRRRLEERPVETSASWELVDKLKAQVAELQQQLEGAQSKQGEAVDLRLQEELETLTRRAEEAEFKVLELEEQLSARETPDTEELEELRSRVQFAEARAVQLEQQAAQAATSSSEDSDELAQKYELALVRISELEEQMATRFDSVDRMPPAVTVSQEGELEELSEQLVVAQEEIARLEAELELARDAKPDRETRKLAYADQLTGLPNFNNVRQYLRVVFERVQSGEGAVALLLLDLDRFRVVNDTLGHRTGDELLRLVAKRLQELTRKDDYALARRGEDEFMIIAHLGAAGSDASQLNAMARGLAHTLLKELANPFELSGQTIHLKASIGISMLPGEAGSAQELLEQAETAMYRAKELGRARVTFYTQDLHLSQRRRLELEQELRTAIAENQFLMYYQPVVDLQGGRLAGVEALLRWGHPTRGLLEPRDFLDIAEDSGLIIPIGDWAMREAMGIAQTMKKDRFVSINLSSRQLIDADFAGRFMNYVSAAGIRPNQMVVEISETTSAIDPERMRNALAKLSHWDVGIAIDDFGTGATSLAELHKIQASYIKIDREFVRQTPEDRSSAQICQAVANLAAGLNVKSSAVGVETESQAAYMAKCGCSMAQGHHFSAPVPANQLADIVNQRWSV